MEIQIGRTLRGESTVAARCPLDLPTVADVPPILEDGTPFPTRYWLTCPLATKRIARLEAANGVKRMEGKRQSDPEFARQLDAAHRRYETDRDALIPSDHSGPRPTGGVAGLGKGIKCLHAHYADTAAGNQNPVGSLVASWVESLNCVMPCVVDGEMNPKWVEPL